MAWCTVARMSAPWSRVEAFDIANQRIGILTTSFHGGGNAHARLARQKATVNQRNTADFMAQKVGVGKQEGRRTGQI